MSTPWIIAVALQMLVTVALTVIVLSLVRQLGILAVRLNPSAGMQTEEGPGPGTELPAQEIPLLSGGAAQFAGQRSVAQLVVFLSPDCTICNAVAHYVRLLHRQYDDELDLLVILQATPRVAREYVRDHDFGDVPVALKQSFPSTIGISSTPFALSISSDGTAAGRGVPNALEHLEEVARLAQTWDPSADLRLTSHDAQTPSIHLTDHVEAVNGTADRSRA